MTTTSTPRRVRIVARDAAGTEHELQPIAEAGGLALVRAPDSDGGWQLAIIVATGPSAGLHLAPTGPDRFRDEPAAQQALKALAPMRDWRRLRLPRRVGIRLFELAMRIDRVLGTLDVLERTR